MAAEVGDMMQDAMRLKSAQVAKERMLFNARAQSLQHSIFHPEQFQDTVRCRRNAVETRISDCDALKALGNEYFKQQRYQDAISMYERSVGCLVYLVSERSDWRQNMRDSDLGIIDDVHNTCTSLTGTPRNREAFKLPNISATSPNVVLQAEQLLAALYGNLATCAAALGDLSRAHAEACEGLARAPKHPKLLLKRAQIAMKPQGAGTTELRLALADLNAAVATLKQDGNVYSVPQAVVASIHKHYRLFADQATAQQRRDKAQFQGMFGRGSVVDAKNEAQLRAAAAQQAHAPAIGDGTRRQLAAMRQTLATLETEGKMEQARELSEHIARAEQQILAHSAASQPAEDEDDVDLDFENPSEEMKRLAAQMGIDLSRPEVLNELHTLNAQQKRRAAGPAQGTFTNASSAASAAADQSRDNSTSGTHEKVSGGSDAGADDATVDDLVEHISVMPLEELIAFLDKQELMTADEARALGEQQVRDKAIRMLRSAQDPAAAEKGTRALMVRYIVFALAFVFAIYRLHSMGILQWMFTGESPANQRSAPAFAAAGTHSAQGSDAAGDWGLDESGDTLEATVEPDGTIH